MKLQRAGHEFKACCPFHNEKTPSFYVNDQKGFYHCFGCEAHGDAIRWMTEQQGLQFMDAVKELALIAGMDVPAPDPRTAKRQEEAKGLRDLMDAAQTWFRANLDGSQGPRRAPISNDAEFRPGRSKASASVTRPRIAPRWARR